jgi:hypothetical protein
MNWFKSPKHSLANSCLEHLTVACFFGASVAPTSPHRRSKLVFKPYATKRSFYRLSPNSYHPCSNESSCWSRIAISKSKRREVVALGLWVKSFVKSSSETRRKTTVICDTMDVHTLAAFFKSLLAVRTRNNANGWRSWSPRE